MIMNTEEAYMLLVFEDFARMWVSFCQTLFKMECIFKKLLDVKQSYSSQVSPVQLLLLRLKPTYHVHTHPNQLSQLMMRFFLQYLNII